MEPKEPKGPICQSCVMPMEKPEDFGTEADGSRNEEYTAGFATGTAGSRTRISPWSR